MRYFDYQHSGTLGRVWSLFSSLGNLPTEKCLGHTDYSHTMEIVNVAMNGNFEGYEENFNLEAYEYKCNENDRIAKISLADKVLYIVDNVEEDSKVGYGEVHENNLNLSTKGDYEEALDRLDFDSSFDKLLDVRKHYIKTIGVDLVNVLRACLRGVPEAIEKIKILTDKDKNLYELISVMCDNSQVGVLLKRLEELE